MVEPGQRLPAPLKCVPVYDSLAGSLDGFFARTRWRLRRPASFQSSTFRCRGCFRRQKPGGFYEFPVTVQDGSQTRPGIAYVRDDPGRCVNIQKNPVLTQDGTNFTHSVGSVRPDKTKCFVISLARARLRRRYVEHGLRAALSNFQVEVVDAVDGQALMACSAGDTAAGQRVACKPVAVLMATSSPDEPSPHLPASERTLSSSRTCLPPGESVRTSHLKVMLPW